jgi:hypothetical protein
LPNPEKRDSSREVRFYAVKRVVDTSEALGTVALPGGTCELYATADAGYDEEASRLVVRLNSYVRTLDPRSREKPFSPDWLPKPDVVTESVGPDEALEAARDIFHRWGRKVRESAPSLHSPTF